MALCTAGQGSLLQRGALYLAALLPSAVRVQPLLQPTPPPTPDCSRGITNGWADGLWQNQ